MFSFSAGQFRRNFDCPPADATCPPISANVLHLQDSRPFFILLPRKAMRSYRTGRWLIVIWINRDRCQYHPFTTFSFSILLVKSVQVSFVFGTLKSGNFTQRREEGERLETEEKRNTVWTVHFAQVTEEIPRPDNTLSGWGRDSAKRCALRLTVRSNGSYTMVQPSVRPSRSWLYVSSLLFTAVCRWSTSGSLVEE